MTTSASPPDIPGAVAVSDVASAANAIIDELERAVIGKRDVLHQLLVGVLAGGHILFEDLPGLAKTLIARSFAQVTDMDFARIQFTPDLVPADITGSTIYNPGTGSGVFTPGPVFANLVLGDEINRAPPKTQAAVLEAMEERQVTIDGVSHPLPTPFTVIATQNPIEQGGTYPLPEAQLDRFLLKLSVGYPATTDETTILLQRVARQQEQIELRKVVSGRQLHAMQRAVETVHVDRSVAEYIVGLVADTRDNTKLQAGASPRGALGLLKAARAHAALSARDFVTPDDVREMAAPTLSHRLVLDPDEWLRGTDPAEFVHGALSRVPAPPTIRPSGNEPTSMHDR